MGLHFGFLGDIHYGSVDVSAVYWEIMIEADRPTNSCYGQGESVFRYSRWAQSRCTQVNR